MKIMIATGGTGGHINPALDLAHILKQRNPENEVIFVGSDNRMEATVIPDAGYKFYGLHITTTAGSLFSKVTYATSLIKAYFESKQILKQEKPDICIGFGNYISVPLILAAHHIGIKTMLLEVFSIMRSVCGMISPTKPIMPVNATENATASEETMSRRFFIFSTSTPRL